MSIQCIDLDEVACCSSQSSGGLQHDVVASRVKLKLHPLAETLVHLTLQFVGEALVYGGQLICTESTTEKVPHVQI